MPCAICGSTSHTTAQHYGAQEFERWTGKVTAPETVPAVKPVPAPTSYVVPGITGGVSVPSQYVPTQYQAAPGVYPQYAPTTTPRVTTPTPATTPTGAFNVDQFLTPTPTATTPAPTTTGGGMPEVPPRDQWPEGFHPQWDPSGQGYVWVMDSPGTTEQDKIDQENWLKQFAQSQKEWEATLEYQYTALAQQAQSGDLGPKEYEMALANLDLQKQQFAYEQQETQRQYQAQLAAKPINWLQYAAYTGQQPVVQPWMLPLMSQQYGFNAGGAIPGWTAESAAGMPSLTNPSAQYLSRMGPTAQQQYYGYQQAKSGVTPEETQWRLWSAAPPGGAATQLSYAA